MAWIKVESSVARNRKFVKAGPGPSWLWLCGLAYCQEGLTNGFIPIEAIDYLGVKSARHLAKHLVSAGLWDAIEGGWQVHDYLKHNRSADEVEGIKAKRRTGGKLGGRPLKEPPEKPSNNREGFTRETFAVAVADGAAVDAVVEGGPGETDPPMDQWLLVLQREYPAHRVTRSHRTEQAFVQQLLGFPDGPEAGWAVLVANLDSNKLSHEWRVKGMIPRLEKYLGEGLWRNALPADAPVGEQLSPRTLRMLGGA